MKWGGILALFRFVQEWSISLTSSFFLPRICSQWSTKSGHFTPTLIWLFSLPSPSLFHIHSSSPSLFTHIGTMYSLSTIPLLFTLFSLIYWLIIRAWCIFNWTYVFHWIDIDLTFGYSVISLMYIRYCHCDNKLIEDWMASVVGCVGGALGSCMGSMLFVESIAK